MGDDIMSYNGGVALAMKGKECVAIACDKRYGVQNKTIATNFTKIFQYVLFENVSFFLKVQTVSERLRFRTNLYELREQRKLKPLVLYNMLTNLLYERRFGPYFVYALVIGLDPKTGETYVFDSDNIGAISDNVNLATVGTASDYIFGLGELFFKPNMNADELFEATSQALLNGVDRDSASGWGAVVYVVEKDKVTVRELKGRQD
ncbi:unnamed protein product [Rotaria magnacalcarata]|uniref:Proteasome subunit beta n=1 Tax=Rotaria magnacalcarata TaxID=392030 RepID=A0A815ML40_9BILA|nr:unnamed protein product [Rotaria magnacalcarata]CAF1684076.1 unnamed protein product [Rotaria magnacalcarata]CAF2052916.1 unnamed protein product [Rotaria magnacalcarata]CAF2131191.1 unnamed protein product [Rotaria magnacalcarata]CAF2141201.1 unnamed protein product [Rotaria magnacalcarata]